MEGALFAGSVIDPGTIQAYLETDYHVRGDMPVTLNVGIANPALLALYRLQHVESCAFITACNPLGQTFDETTNLDRQAALAHELQFRNITFIEGIGQHPTNKWSGEPSFLALGVSLEAAKSLGIKYEQNAIIWSGPAAIPQLILLR